ncbi:penicillin-binding protein activator [Microvirga sp. BT291]|nr:penicillin-binding protein activator [Microvirga pudoricolor]MBM6595005.1 penicillin-binding protein activator [Microvirga pudoricolor]
MSDSVPPAPMGSITAQPIDAVPGQGAPVGGAALGAGSVKVALILPLSGPGQGAVAAQSMRNAADLALTDFQGSDLQLLVKDDRGTPDGARQATGEAIAEGAELIIGPLYAGSVQATAGVARQAGRPVVAFSSDSNVAARGVYLLSFLVQEEVERIVSYAASQNRRSIAALIPETTYGSVVDAAFREAAGRHGVRVVAIERYASGGAAAAVRRLAGVIGGASPQADALFIPDNGDGLPTVAQALAGIGFDPGRVKPLGTGVWNEPRVFALPALQGGWFAAPDGRGFEAFSQRYRARFNMDPTRLATLSYDAVTLAAALSRTQGSRRFQEDVITNPAGFAGADGVFRFNPDGTNSRGLAVQEIRGGTIAIVSASPRTLAAAQ